jgi:hypothetical protein
MKLAGMIKKEACSFLSTNEKIARTSKSKIYLASACIILRVWRLIIMGKWMRNWLIGMALLGVAAFVYMALSPREEGASLEEEIEETDSSLIRERARSRR